MDIQARHQAWMKQRAEADAFVVPDSLAAMLFLQEEIGELQHEFNYLMLPEYVRNHPRVGDAVLLTKELCDVLSMVLTVATVCGIDLDTAFEQWLRKERA